MTIKILTIDLLLSEKKNFLGLLAWFSIKSCYENNILCKRPADESIGIRLEDFRSTLKQQHLHLDGLISTASFEVKHRELLPGNKLITHRHLKYGMEDANWHSVDKVLGFEKRLILSRRTYDQTTPESSFTTKASEVNDRALVRTKPRPR